MRKIILCCPLVLVACGGNPAPAPTSTPASQPASAPTGHHAHHHGEHHGEHGHVHHHGFEDPEKWADRWDTAERDGWQKPDAVIAAIAPTATDHVADIGAGTGYFAVRLAAKVPQGKVYAVDVQPEMVAYLAKRAEALGLGNFEAVKATFEDARIPEPVDLIMLTNTYHHISDRPAYFTRLAASLKPGGRVAIVDYKLHFEGHGPPQAMRLAPDAVVAEMTEAGYRVGHRDEDTLPRQYILIFDRAEASAAGSE